MRRRDFFKFLAGVAVMAATDPLKLIPAKAAPGATPATALPCIIEGPVTPAQLYGAPLANRALSKRLRHAAIAETKILQFMRDEG